jgi:CheY-like chemotaxis protein
MPKQILLVDDSVTIQRVVELTFAHEADYKVTAAKSADEGLQKARDLKPDIVLADAGMAGKSGYDLCASLRSDGALASVPVLILTGNFAPYDEARGTKSGADGYVVKPFETQALIDKVTDAINKKGARPAAIASAPPIVATTAARKDDSLEISIEGGKSVPTPVPATRPAAPPPPAPPPPAAKPATSAPQARTMMGIPAPTITPPTPPPAPRPAPPPAAAASPPPSVAPPVAAPPAPKPAPTPVAAAAAAMPASVPQMPRAPMIPGVPMPSAPAARSAEPPKAPPPRATLMGIPTVNPSNLPPGAVALPVPGTKPAAPWAPPTPAAHAPTPAHTPAAHAPPPSPPAPSAAHASMVSAVADRAVADMSARGADYEAVAKLSREVIERIAWEVVPELAETIIREQLDRLVAERQK